MKQMLLFMFILICSLLSSITWQIKQDGTGNFPTIQEGIIAATDNDTVLVYPGIYYENIDYLEKSLTVASLYIITPEDSLINQTIIDGNQQFRCVTIDDCESASIIGFTIQNGYALLDVASGYQGGGIFINDNLNCFISSCKIQFNKSRQGGGIHAENGYIELVNNIISFNQAVELGGAITIMGFDTILQFNQTELNNIYLNYAATGAEISISSAVPNTVDIIVDTFTVSNPDYFFITRTDDITFSCLNAKIEEVDQDLYVSPDGDDNDSGLTDDESLQTLAWAQTIIKRNDENPHTIHLAEGIYSSSLNNQIFPLNVKYGVCYSGASTVETILDAESESNFFFQFQRNQNEFAKLVVENLTMTNSVQLANSFGGITIYQADVNLTNVLIENCNGGTGSAVLTMNGYCNLTNVIIRNNTGGRGVLHSVEYNCPNPILDANFINTKFQNNNPGSEFYSGGGAMLGGHSNIAGNYNAQLINCEISDNYNSLYDSVTDMGGTSGLYLKDMELVDVVNSTFGDNTSHSSGCTISVHNTELNLYNTVLYDNDGNSIILWEDAVVNISNSLIEGGDDNIRYYYPLAIVNWMEGNLDQNPYWDVDGDNPYALLGNSPCINTGTLDLPAGIELPEFDLARNPRIYGETIDMGAFEFQGDPQSNDENEIIIPEITKISNYPNPFNPSTTIKLDLAESGKIELAIYNIKGQKVKTLLDAYSTKGHFEIIWQGIDDNNDKVASGQYFIRLKVDGEEKAVRKCILLK